MSGGLIIFKKAACIEPVQDRHVYIQQNKIWLQCLSALVSLRAVECNANPITSSANQFYQQAQFIQAVVDNKQVRGGFYRLCSHIAHLVFASASVSIRSKSRVLSACCTRQIGRAHVCTPVPNAHHLRRPMLEQKKKN